MTRKRLRYSDLAAPVPPEAESSPAPEVEPASTGADALAAAPSEPAPIVSPANAGTDAAPRAVHSLDAALPDVQSFDDGLLEQDILQIEHLDVGLLGDLGISIEHDDDMLLGDAGDDHPVGREDDWTISGPATRPRRNSTPVELARTLAAEHAAAHADTGAPPIRDRRVAEPTARVDEQQRSLRDRARAHSGDAELLMFRAGGERFAVELILVDEVIDLPVIHHVPEMPPAMAGVITVRGSLTAVYTPHHALGVPFARRDVALIFRRGAQRVGILIDDVDDALTVDLSELRDKPDGDEAESVLLGVIRLDNSLVGIVDTDALITACQSANILEPA